MTNVYDKPVSAIFSVCKVYEKQTLYLSTDVCECFSLSLAVIFKVPLLMYAYCCRNVCICWTPAVNATRLLVEQHFSLLSHWGSAVQTVNGNIIVWAPGLPSSSVFPLWGLRSRGLKPGKTISIHNIPGIISDAFDLPFTGANITSSFKKIGVWPFDTTDFILMRILKVLLWQKGQHSTTNLAVWWFSQQWPLPLHVFAMLLKTIASTVAESSCVFDQVALPLL